MIDFNSMLNTRCRLQRHADLRFYTGWVRRADPKEIRIELADEAIIAVGDRVSVEAVVEGATVGITCLVSRREKDTVHFAIADYRVSRGNGQEPRYQTEGLYAVLHGLEDTIEADAVDISASGIGLLCDCQVPRFMRLRMDLRGPGGFIECFGRVCYCRKDPRHPGCYRVGIRVELNDSYDQNRWNRLVASASGRNLEAAA